MGYELFGSLDHQEIPGKWSGQKNLGQTGSGKKRRKPAQNCHFCLFFGVVQILGAEDEISKNVLESPFQELSNNSSTVSVPLQEQNPGRRPGRAFLSTIYISTKNLNCLLHAIFYFVL